MTSHNEVARAIYIDLEGFVDTSPSLVGMLVEDLFEQIVLDPGLATAAQAKGLRSVSPKKYFEWLLRRAKSEDRRICAFTRHELTTVAKHFDIDLSTVYLDGHKLAKSWWKRSHPGIRPDAGWSQAFFEEQLGLERPRHLRGGNATSRIRSVTDQLERHGAYEQLRPVAKGKWTKLLAYNELDVRHLASIVRAAASAGALTRSRPQ